VTGDEALSPFELATAELRALGITLASLPGEYRVNFRNGADATALTVETLDEALALGRSMVAAAAPASANPAHGKRRRRPLRMTPKAIRRRMIRKHNLRMRARVLRQQQDTASRADRR
jgi:hypothetical protein